jgi:polysaccharide deacetylase family protein (PEP-CTERM system associated)
MTGVAAAGFAKGVVMSGIEIRNLEPAGPDGAFVLTVDVEEWFHVCGVPGLEGPEQWRRLPSRVDADVDRLLELLERHRARATFFVLGWLAETRPGLVGRIASAGHEIGCHSHLHQPVNGLEPASFEVDLERSLALLRDQAAGTVTAYRAPMWSLGVSSTPWAFEVLARHGIRIDSSLTRAPVIGDNTHPREAAELELPGGERLLECPPLTGRRFGVGGVFLGGAWPLRLFGPSRGLRVADRLAGRGLPAVWFLHPWELDPDPPRHPMPAARRFVHYAGLRRGRSIWPRLFTERTFVSLGDVVKPS